jgi:hypothetical protein
MTLPTRKEEAPTEFLVQWLDPRKERLAAMLIASQEGITVEEAYPHIDPLACLRYVDAANEERARVEAKRLRKQGLGPIIYRRVDLTENEWGQWNWDEELVTDEYAWKGGAS